MNTYFRLIMMQHKLLHLQLFLMVQIKPEVIFLFNNNSKYIVVFC